ncbi:hypothetical protein P8605_30765, partial [Streptomyces sp. T-3]|nr:hypothetical protein [Streptomyces sp. T-3]
MPHRSPNTALAALLAEARWSAGDLARTVNAEGARSGVDLRYDRTAVAHWLQGSRPRAPVPELVARVLGQHLGRPIRPVDAGLAEAAQELLPGPPP